VVCYCCAHDELIVHAIVPVRHRALAGRWRVPAVPNRLVVLDRFRGDDNGQAHLRGVSRARRVPRIRDRSSRAAGLVGGHEAGGARRHTGHAARQLARI